MKTIERNGFIDFAKGFSIILVIVGHCIQYGSGNYFFSEEMYFENILFKIIYSFHMPLFIAISGFLFYFSLQKHGARNSCIRRMQKLLYPIVTWALLHSVVETVHGGGTLATGAKKTILYALTDFWFLWAVIIRSVLIALLEALPSQAKAPCCILLMICFFLMPDRFWWNAYKFMFPFFLLGYYYAKCKGQAHLNRIVGIASCAVWLLLLAWYNKDSYIYTSAFTLVRHTKGFDWKQQLGIDIHRYAVGFAGTMVIVVLIYSLYLSFSKATEWGNKVVGLVSLLGKDSLYIYILSTYAFTEIMPKLTANLHLNYGITVLETIITLVCCEVAAKVILHFKPLSKLLLGA